MRPLLAPLGLRLDGLETVANCPEIVEDGDSFLANATIKATVVARATGGWAIGEDSGLCVDALDGAPGLYSARFAGSHGDDTANNAKLVAALEDVAESRRTAHYRSVIVLCDAAGDVLAFAEGRCHGRIVTDARGENGFGYDPHFLIREYHRTFGQLPVAVKAAISHRSRAIRQFVPMVRAVVTDHDASPT